MSSQWYIQPAFFVGVPQLTSAPPSAAMAYALVPYVGNPSATAPWPCFPINFVSGQAVPAAAAANATPPVVSGALALPPAPAPAPAPPPATAPATAVGITMRIVLHGRGGLGLWTRIVDVPYQADNHPDPASIRAAVAAATRLHYPPDGRLLRHAATGGAVVPPPTLHLWAMRAGAQLRMLPGEAGGGALGTEEVERTVAVRAEDPGGDDDDECNKAEAEAVRGLLEHASEGRLGVFLLVNMDGDDGLGVPGHGGRGIGAP